MWLDVGGLPYPLEDTVLRHQTPLPEDPVCAGMGKLRQDHGEERGREGLSKKEALGCEGLGVWSWGLRFRALKKLVTVNHQKPLTASFWHHQPWKHLQRWGEGGLRGSGK